MPTRPVKKNGHNCFIAHPFFFIENSTILASIYRSLLLVSAAGPTPHSFMPLSFSLHEIRSSELIRQKNRTSPCPIFSPIGVFLSRLLKRAASALRSVLRQGSFCPSCFCSCHTVGRDKFKQPGVFHIGLADSVEILPRAELLFYTCSRPTAFAEGRLVEHVQYLLIGSARSICSISRAYPPNAHIFLFSSAEEAVRRCPACIDLSTLK
ncbi:hypothetical protein GGR50DRAFT_548315 [Xylaria sp. CBS 124048]|nr:hypothetical protein GGR50DRAFT_548315 [Xylaria sp. CBS 124048]